MYTRIFTHTSSSCLQTHAHTPTSQLHAHACATSPPTPHGLALQPPRPALSRACTSAHLLGRRPQQSLQQQLRSPGQRPGARHRRQETTHAVQRQAIAEVAQGAEYDDGAHSDLQRQRARVQVEGREAELSLAGFGVLRAHASTSTPSRHASADQAQSMNGLSKALH